MTRISATDVMIAHNSKLARDPVHLRRLMAFWPEDNIVHQLAKEVLANIDNDRTGPAHHFDSQAMEVASRIMEIVSLESIDKERWTDVRLTAAIQIEVISAMQWAAPQRGS